MTGRIVDIKRFAVHDGPGIRTTVFLKGCSLKCRWCHNPESISAIPQIAYYKDKCINCGECVTVCESKAHAVLNGTHLFTRDNCTFCGKCEKVCLGHALTFYGRDITTDELFEKLFEDKSFFENSDGGVTLSGGEPLLQIDFCEELLKKLKSNGIHTAVDTCGFVPRANFERILPYTDIFLYDIKHIDNKKHKANTGNGNIEILDNLKYIDGKNANIEIRIPFIPTINDDDACMASIGEFLGGLSHITRVKVLPYHSMAGSKYLSLAMENTLPAVTPPTDAEVDKAAQILKKYGLNAINGRK